MNERNPRDSEGPFTDLSGDPNAWSTWAPRPESAPRFHVDAQGGPGGRAALVISGGGNACACGCWRVVLPGLLDARRYRLEVAFRSEGQVAPAKSIRAIVTSQAEGDIAKAFIGQLDPAGTRDGWRMFSHDLRGGDFGGALSLELFLAWAPDGSVRWGDARLYDVTDRPVPSRQALLAVVNGNPARPRSPAECIDFYTDRLEEAASNRVDLVCLPELINTTGIPGDAGEFAEPIPGPTSERLADVARTCGLYIAAGILERQGGGVYNTGLLIDRTGGVLGKYRKTHLPIAEALLRGTTPGEGYPVFHTDFGTVGMMICADGHFPEVARILSLAGAEVILFPNMGDGREGGGLWESIARTRAVDNQVHVAAAVNSGRSCIVSPRGAFLAAADRTPGAVVSALCEVGTSLRDYMERPIGRRYDQLRRVDTYRSLLSSPWDG